MPCADWKASERRRLPPVSPLRGTWTLILPSPSDHTTVIRGLPTKIRRGGGVAIFYKKSLDLKNIQVTQELVLPETIICDLSLNTTIRFLLCYRAPDYDLEHASKLTTLLAWAASCPYPFIFLGDLNLPLINWTLNECSTEIIHSTMYNAITTLGLDQLVTISTRLNNCLDLIFCNSLNTIYNLHIKEPFSNSDHSMIDFCLNLHPYKESHNRTPKYNFKKANYDLMAADLSSLDWQILFNDCNSAEDYYNTFLFEVHRVINLYVPLVTPKAKKNKLPLSIRKLQ